MGGTAHGSGHEDAGDDPAGRKHRSRFQKPLDGDPVPAGSIDEFDLRFQADQRGHKVGGGKVRAAEIAADRGDVSYGRVGELAGRLCECREVGQVR